jgi:hypothetical protein
MGLETGSAGWLCIWNARGCGVICVSVNGYDLEVLAADCHALSKAKIYLFSIRDRMSMLVCVSYAHPYEKSRLHSEETRGRRASVPKPLIQPLPYPALGFKFCYLAKLCVTSQIPRYSLIEDPYTFPAT